MTDVTQSPLDPGLLDAATETWMIQQGMSDDEKKELRRRFLTHGAWMKERERLQAEDPTTHFTPSGAVPPDGGLLQPGARTGLQAGLSAAGVPREFTGAPERYGPPAARESELGGLPSAADPPPPVDPSRMPTTGEAAPARTQLTTYVDEEGRVVMGNQAPAGAQTMPYEAGLQAWKENAMRDEANRAEMRRLMREGGDIERPGETITVVPPSPFQGRTRPAPTMGRETGDFRVREGRGGFTPSAPVPTAGTITQEEYQNLTPGQQAAYDREYAKWAQKEAVQRELDPLRAYNQAAEQIMRDFPDVQTKLDAYKATLQPYLDDKQITPEMYAMMVEGKKRELVNEAMMAAGASAASMDPRTHQRTGVMGYY